MIINKYLQFDKIIFILFFILFIMPGCVPIYNTHDTRNDNIKYKIENFKPFKIGNPLGNDDNKIFSKRYYEKNTRWWCAYIGASTIIICIYIKKQIL